MSLAPAARRIRDLCISSFVALALASGPPAGAAGTSAGKPTADSLVKRPAPAKAPAYAKPKVEKQVAKVEKLARAGGDKEAKRLHEALVKVQATLDRGSPARAADLYPEERALLKPFFLLTMKPTMYVANVAERGFADNPLLAAVEAHAAKEGAPVVPVCAAIEAEIADLEGEDRKAFLDDLGLSEPGLDRVIHAAYRLLGLQTYFTAGPKEVRAWTVPVGATAPQAAGVIHTDFEKGFIRAETIAYDDYVALGGEHGAKEAGKMRLEGKEYVLRDGDVMHFRFNV